MVYNMFPLVKIRKSRRGFSLVEVALALSIFAFGMVSLLALMPISMTASRKGLDIAIFDQIIDRRIATLEQAAFETLVPNEAWRRLYFDESGKLLPHAEGALYEVHERFSDTDNGHLTRVTLRIRRTTAQDQEQAFCYLIFRRK